MLFPVHCCCIDAAAQLLKEANVFLQILNLNDPPQPTDEWVQPMGSGIVSVILSFYNILYYNYD